MRKYIILTLILGLFLLAFRPVPWLTVSSHNSNIIEHTFNNRLFVQLPQSTKVIENHFSDKGQLSYGVYLNDEDLLFRGYIQLWQLPELEKFLINSRRISTFDFKSYSLEPIVIGNHDGFINEWAASFGDIYNISGKEYWLKKADSPEVLRISFFTDATSFSEEQLQQVDKTVGSIRWN